MNVLDDCELRADQAPHAPVAARFRSRETAEVGATCKDTIRLRLLLLPGFSHLSLSSFVDPLRCANAVTHDRLFEWQTFGLGGSPVASSSGIAVEVGANLDSCEDQRKSALVLFGGDHIEGQSSRRLIAFLRRQARSNVAIYAIGTAAWLLAEAGILRNGVRRTIHWTKLAALSETFQDETAEDALFVRDGNITTCAGEFAAFDLAVEIVENRFGSDLAHRICERLIADRWRSGESCQSIPLGLRFTGAAVKLLQVVNLMEKNTEDPLPLDEMARRASLSRRQVERLFEKHLNTTPRRYYMSIRLERAKQLLETTNMPILDIAVACGYLSSSHFTKSFKDHFRTLPSRIRATMMGRSTPT